MACAVINVLTDANICSKVQKRKAIGMSTHVMLRSARVSHPGFGPAAPLILAPWPNRERKG
jgi:hypothetical protein